MNLNMASKYIHFRNGGSTRFGDNCCLFHARGTNMRHSKKVFSKILTIDQFTVREGDLYIIWIALSTALISFFPLCLFLTWFTSCTSYRTTINLYVFLAHVYENITL